MKRLLILLTFFSFSLGSFASHTLGGSITWECLSNGQYVFFMEHYRDCSGIQWTFQNEVLDVVGSPLPTKPGGSVVNSITMKPNSARQQASNNGDLSPKCDLATGIPFTCDNSDIGSVQAFYYRSEPITLLGTPPSGGWRFYWQAPCCRPNRIDNVSTNGRLMLRAFMYAELNGVSGSLCNNSSPEFTSKPLALSNRGYVSSFNQSAIDSDGDSLVYSLDRPFNGNSRIIEPIIPLNYEVGFSPTSPFPGTDRDSRNNSGMLNQNSGLFDFGMFNEIYGQWPYNRFITVIKVDAYRDGVLNSSIFREVPSSIVNPPLLPDKRQNIPPMFLLGKNDTNKIEISVAAGQKIELPIIVTDKDLSYSQLLTMTMNGSHFSQDFSSTGTCQNFSNSNCAYLDNSILLPDTVLGVPSYKIEAVGQINTTFKWQTNCSLLGPNGRDKTYYFYFDAHDNFCPIPASRAAVIAVTVTNSETTFLPKLECVKSSILGTDIYWNQSVYNSINNFQSLEIYKASSRNGSYTQLTTITDTTVIGFQDLAAPSIDFYYLKVNGTSCSNQPKSIYSDTLTDPDNRLTVTNIPSCFKLSWNAQDRSYQIKYLIYREYPMGSGFKLIDSTYNASEYCDPFTACSDSVNYYISMENGGNCSFDFSAGKATGNNVLMNNGIREINHVLNANVSYGRFQWYDCNKQSIILDETNQTFVPKDTGNYAVILYQYGCVDTSNCILYFPVGLSENSFQSQLNCYPNPNNGLVQIDFKQVQQNVAVEVYSIQGKLVQNQRIQNSESFKIELNQPAGIYFIQLTNEKGERANLKVVKQ